MARIYPDTNHFIDFYRVADNRLDPFAELQQYKDSLIDGATRQRVSPQPPLLLKAHRRLSTTEKEAMKKKSSGKNMAHAKTGKRTKQEFPRGWNERKVRAVIQHYEQLTDEQLAREIETAPEVTDKTLISVPTKLLPAVRNLLLRHQKSA